MDIVIPPGFLGDEDEGELIEWVVGDGDRVEVGQVIATIETAKVNVELPASAAGVISLLVAIGDTVEGGQAVARVSS